MHQEQNMVSLEKCREIVNKNGLSYTDDELLKIRNFMYRLLEISTSHYERLQEAKEGKEAESRKAGIKG